MLGLQETSPGHFIALSGSDTFLPAAYSDRQDLRSSFFLRTSSTPPGVQLNSCSVVPKVHIHILIQIDKKPVNLGQVTENRPDNCPVTAQTGRDRGFCLLFCNTACNMKTDYPRLIYNYEIQRRRQSKSSTWISSPFLTYEPSSSLQAKPQENRSLCRNCSMTIRNTGQKSLRKRL